MSRLAKVRLLLWAYFWMLLLEGAFRRWFLPGLSDLFLVARDPICIAALVLGASAVARSGWAKAFIGCGLVGAILAVLVGHGNPFAAAYGLRIYALHFPLIFLFPVAFDRQELLKMAKCFLAVAIPMTVLLGFQHYLPQTHWVNVGTGGVDSAGFGGALGRFRPPGTFSFITGPSMFFPLCAALLASLWLSGYRPIPKWIWISMAALVLALPLSISRTLWFSYMLVGAATLASGALSPRLLGRVLLVAAGVSVLVLLVSRTSVYQDSMKAFDARWEGANEYEGGEEGAAGALRKRTVGWIGADLERALERAPLLGVGLGSGTSGGAKMLAGKRALNFGESEWGIIFFELGLVLGFIAIILRVAFALSLLASSLRLARRGDGAALPVASVAAVWLVIGVSGQPTSLGFIVMASGLCLALTRQTAVSNIRRRPLAATEFKSTAPQHAARLR